MTRVYYGPDGKGKLVRDNLDEVIRAQGHEVNSIKLAEIALTQAILDKFPEELEELKVAISENSSDERKEEFADVLTLLMSAIKSCGYDFEEIQQIEQEKTAKKGAFDNGTYIKDVGLNPESENYEYWLKHFKDNSDRYIVEEDKNA